MIKLGKQTEEIQEFKRYVGFAPVIVKAVNPNKEELASLGINVSEEPNYVSTIQVDGKEVKQVRVAIYVQTAENDNNIDCISNVNFYCTNEIVTNRDKTKVQVIDEFGETAWLTKEEYQNKQLPRVTRVHGNFRPAKKYEAELTQFIKYWIGKPDSVEWNNSANTFQPINISADELDNYKIALNWEDIMSGKCTEIKDLIRQTKEFAASNGTNYKIKVLFGVRTSDDGHRYQIIYPRAFLRNSSRNYSKFYQRNIEESIKAGALSNQEYSSLLLHEYIPEKTEITAPDNTTVPDTGETFNSNLNDLPF